MFSEVVFLSTNSAEAGCLTIGNCLLRARGMVALAVEIGLSVSGLGVKGGRESGSRVDDRRIKEVNLLTRVLVLELDSGVFLVQVLQEFD